MKGKRKLSLMVVAMCIGGVMYAPDASAMAADSYGEMLDPVFVEAFRERSTYPGGYVVREVDGGLLGQQDFMETPLRVMSLSDETIRLAKYPGNTFGNAVTMIPGVTVRGTNTYNDIGIRGYYISPHDFYLDGVSGMLSQSSLPMNFVDRIEVVSGPSVLLNGMSIGNSAAGTVNLVPKIADGNFVEVMETFSGKGNWEHALDLSHRFGEKQDWGVRMVMDYADGATDFDFETMEKGNIFVNVDHQGKKSSTRVLFGYRYVDQMAPNFSLDLGKQMVPTPPPAGSNFQLPWSRYRYNNRLVTVSHTLQLNDNWQWFLKGGYQDEDWNMCMESYYPWLIDDKGNFEAGLEDVPIRFWRKSISTGVRGDIRTGQWQHQIAFSFDALWHWGRGADWFPDDIFHGNIYDHSIGSADNKMPEKQMGDWYYSGAQRAYGFGLADRISTQDDRWSVLLGIRNQHVSAQSGHDGKKYTQSDSQSAWSPNVGVMYRINPETAIYANYMEGLSKGFFVSKHYGYKNAGEYLRPRKMRQKEVGVKWDLGNISTSLSVFEVRQENIGLTEDKVYTYLGQQKNRGVEWTIFGEPSPRWSILGGLMYLDAKQDNGMRLGGEPRWSATMSAQYRCNDRLSLNLRWWYEGSAYADAGMKKKVVAWHRTDIGMTYRPNWHGDDGMELDVQIYNLWNKSYWIAGGHNTVQLAGPRTAVVSLSYKW